MTHRLLEILHKRYEGRDKEMPWVFWYSYLDPKAKTLVKGPYKDRKKIMRTLASAAIGRFVRLFIALKPSISVAVTGCSA